MLLIQVLSVRNGVIQVQYSLILMDQMLMTNKMPTSPDECREREFFFVMSERTARKRGRVRSVEVEVCH